MLTPPELTPLETAVGFPLRSERRRARVAPVRETPLAALEASIEPWLAQEPCAVAFSGGRDSSLVLAAAVRAARRWGRPPPLPVTLRFVGRPEADESTWQERVIGHLGLADWLRVEVSDETDLVGPVAQESLLRHGPLYPANAHSVVPALGALRGGSLLTGQGGDEVLGGHRWTPLNEVLGRRRRPGRHDATRLLTAALPRPVRGRVTRGLAAVGELPWLRLDARKQAAGLARRRPDEPVRFDRAVAAAAQGRGVFLAVEAFQRVARAHGVTAGAPLIDSRFIGALAHAGGRTGWGGRRAVMTAVAGDALPSELIERRTKADFTRCFFGQHSHEFARGWSGKGLDESLVDADAVRMAWLGKNADFRAAMLLQSAWLHERADTEPLTRAA